MSVIAKCRLLGIDVLLVHETGGVECSSASLTRYDSVVVDSTSVLMWTLPDSRQPAVRSEPSGYQRGPGRVP